MRRRNILNVCPIIPFEQTICIHLEHIALFMFFALHGMNAESF